MPTQQTTFAHLVGAMLLAAALLAPRALVAGPALTKEEAAKAEATALDAKFKFKAGKHEEAAPLFLQAFALSRKPALLYNAARAYEEAGKPAEAKVAFEQYLTLPGVSASGKRDAQQHIRKLEAQIAAKKKAEAAQQEAAAQTRQKEAARRQQQEQAARDAAARQAAAKQAAAKQAAAQQAAAQAAQQKAEGSQPPTSGTTPSPSRNKWVTYGLVATGGLFLLVGVGGQLQANQEMTDANAMDFAVDNKFDQEQRDAKKKEYNGKVAAAQQKQGNAIVSVLLGLGLGGWAAYRLVTPDPGVAGSTTSSLWLQPSVRPSAAGVQGQLTLGGRF